MNEKETFAHAMQTALEEAKKTGDCYYVLFPYIANPSHGAESVHLVAPIMSEHGIHENEKDQIAFTIFPNGRIEYGDSLASGQSDQQVKFSFSGTVIQTIVPTIPNADMHVDMLQLLKDGCLTTLKLGGDVLQMPSMKTVGRVVDIEVLDDTEYFDFTHPDDDGLPE